MVAGGGTGGHFFPALEVARALKERGERVFFVGVKRGIEAKLAPKFGFDIRFFPFEGLRGRGIFASFKAVLKLPVAVALAVNAVRVEEVRGIFCTGGYASFPAAVAAVVAGIPLFIHEQNSVPGWANLFASRFAREVWVSFQESGRCFVKARRIRHTGNVVRKNIRDVKYRLPPLGVFRLLVIGGSSGARTINKAVCDALPQLNRLGLVLRHQVGGLDAEWVQERYREAGVPWRPEVFIEDMLSAYREASFVISRAGATTLFELSGVGRTGILVPYPYAVGDHQRINAEVLAVRGAALCIDNSELSGENLLKVVVRFFFNRRLIVRMSQRIYRILKLCDVEGEIERLRNEVSV